MEGSQNINGGFKLKRSVGLESFFHQRGLGLQSVYGESPSPPSKGGSHLGETKNPKDASLVQIPLLRQARRPFKTTEANKASLTNQSVSLLFSHVRRVSVANPSLVLRLIPFCFSNNGLSKQFVDVMRCAQHGRQENSLSFRRLTVHYCCTFLRTTRGGRATLHSVAAL